MHTVTKLPYMGKPAEPKFLRAEQRTKMQFTAVRSDVYDSPEDIFIAKVERLAKMIPCTEREAEDIILNRL